MGLKVIALVSGGKDSFFSLLHCIANDHEVVALANLHPRTLGRGGEAEDIESFMYQTIGHTIIPLYAEALGIPLFRQEIIGDAVNDQREYAPPPHGEDETESLVPLLLKVKKAIPEANAVSTGAILSTYQRTRVESVAVRLGLVPLSYLWQYIHLPPYTQTSLLEDMRLVGQEARIIKVASGGLDESFLWQDVADVRTISRMKMRMQLFGAGEGGALIGEGGEFETLALDGPVEIWRKRIEVKSTEKVAGEGGSAFVRVHDAKVVDKSLGNAGNGRRPRIPPLLDVEFDAVFRELEAIDQQVEETDTTTRPDPANLWVKDITSQSEISSEDYLQLPNILSPSGSITLQMEAIALNVQEQLKAMGLNTIDIVHSTLLLRRMADFTAVNPIYGSLFQNPNPPSRVTISCGDLLPQGADIILSVIVDASRSRKRQGLHVQSRSYWAPANIGPYSQAISIPLNQLNSDDENFASEPRLVHVAGQIPLVPASMEMVSAAQLPAPEHLELGDDGDFLAQTILSLQHLWRIGRAMDVQSFTGAVAFISACSGNQAKRRVAIACAVWDEIHKHLKKKEASDEDDEADDQAEFDVWDVKNRIATVSTSTEDKDSRTRLPQFPSISLGNIEGPNAPPVFIVQVAELPRAADIEWCSSGIASAAKIHYLSRELDGFIQQSCIVDTSTISRTEVIFLGFKTNKHLRSAVDRRDIIMEELNLRVVTAYVRVALPSDILRKLKPMVVPCFGIWGAGAKKFDVLLVLKRDIKPLTS